MDPEEQRQLEQSLIELSRTMSQLSGVFSDNINAINSLSTSTTKQSSDTTTSNLSKNKFSGSLTALEISAKKAQATADATSKSLQESFSKGASAVTGLAKSLVSSQEGLSKYGASVDNAGLAALQLGSNFGIVGLAIGGVIAIFGKITKEVFKVDDSIINIRDSFTKTAGILPMTTTQIGQLAKNARFSLGNMQKLGNEMNSLGGDLMGLGGNAGQGAEKFMKLAAVSDETRRQFGRLGVSQDDLMHLQALYVKNQAVSGKHFANLTKSDADQQKDSIAYAKTLITLSTITGKSADALQDEINQTQLSFEEQAQRMKENSDIARLEASSDPADKAKAAKIRKEQENRDKMIETYTALYGKDKAMQMARVMRTGYYDKTTAGLASLKLQNGQDVISFTQKLKTSEDAQKDLLKEADALDTAIIQKTSDLGSSIQVQGEEVAKTQGLDAESTSRITDRGGLSPSEMSADAIKKMNEKGAAGADPLADKIEGIRSVERETQAQVQSFLEGLDPLRNKNNILKDAVLAAALAVGAIATVKIAGGISSTMFGGGAAGAAEAAAGATGGLKQDKSGRWRDATGKFTKGPAVVGAGPGPSAGVPKQGLGESLKSVADSLSKAGAKAPMIMLGAGALSVAVVELGGAFALVTGMMSVAIKAFGEGLQSFSKVDGKNLAAVGIGLTGLTVGVVGLAAAAPALIVINALAKITSGKGVLDNVADMLIKLQKKNFDRKKLENNGSALMSYAKAMAALSALGAASGIANAIKGVFGAIVKIPTAQPPFKELEKFSKLTVDPTKTKTNADAFILYSTAMSAYKGGPGLLTAVSQIAGAKLVELFGQDGPLDSFKKFTDIEVGPKAAENAKAFFNFAAAMGILSGLNSGLLGNLVGGAVGGAVVGAAKVAGKVFSAIGGSAVAAVGATGQAVGNATTGAISTVGDWLMNLIGQHEGVRNKPYKDSKGLWTVGIGHLIGDGKTLPPEWNKTFSDAEVKALFKQDYDHHAKAAANIPGYDKVNEKGKGALVDMTFNMGPSWYKKWPNFTKALGSGDTEGAIAQMQSSLWSKQVGNRANNDIALLRGSSLKAAKGGLFTGSTQGYPMQLHGTELVIPVTPNSILMKLSANPESMIAAMERTTKSNTTTVSKKITTTANSTGKRTPGINHAMIASLAIRFDQVITTIQKSDRVNKKIIKHSSV